MALPSTEGNARLSPRTGEPVADAARRTRAAAFAAAARARGRERISANMRVMSIPMPTRRGLRLGSGLVLFTYIAAHLANHALGLVSVAAAEHGLNLALRVWHSVPGTILLYGAAATHVTLALDALYRRRTLRMPRSRCCASRSGWAFRSC